MTVGLVLRTSNSPPDVVTLDKYKLLLKVKENVRVPRLDEVLRVEIRNLYRTCIGSAGSNGINDLVKGCCQK